MTVPYAKGVNGEALPGGVAVAWEEGLEVPARTLAARLGLPLAQLRPTGGEGLTNAALHLHVTATRLELREVGKRAAGPVYADFVSGRAEHRRRFGGGRDQPLARAVLLKTLLKGGAPRILDATAGLGRDAFVLASLGAAVRLIERSVVVGALLENALERARVNPEVAPIAARMSLTVGDAAEVMAHLSAESRPEVVYLDPMYPHRDGKGALQKKEMRLFRLLVGEDADADALLEAALKCARKRVVVKRPRGAPPLTGRTPDAETESKNTRYDLYTV